MSEPDGSPVGDSEREYYDGLMNGKRGGTTPDQFVMAYINAVAEYNHTEYPDPSYTLEKHIGVRLWELAHEGERAPIASSTDLCTAATKAYEDYGKRKGFDWRSFFNGVQEGFALRIDADVLAKEKEHEI